MFLFDWWNLVSRALAKLVKLLVDAIQGGM